MALSVFFKVEFEEKLLKQKESIACVEFLVHYYNLVLDVLFYKWLR